MDALCVYVFFSPRGKNHSQADSKIHDDLTMDRIANDSWASLLFVVMPVNIKEYNQSTVRAKKTSHTI